MEINNALLRRFLDTTDTGFEGSCDCQRGDIGTNTAAVMNRTADGTTSQLLNGGYSSQVGVAKSLKVYPGDKVKADVYAKYWNDGNNTSGLSNFAAVLTAAFGVSSSSTGELLNKYNGFNAFGLVAAGEDRYDDDDESPKGFITILLFDKHHNFLDAAWDQLDEDYDQDGVVNNDPFDHLVKEVTVTEEGYAYIFVSNENSTQVDIHFDDFKVAHTKSNVIQYNEYYPFGLNNDNSWTRELHKNDFKYNSGSELNVTSGWYEMFFRGYDPALGRMMQVDPMATKYAGLGPYQYSFNNPAYWNDPNGADPKTDWLENWVQEQRGVWDAYERGGLDGMMYYSMGMEVKRLAKEAEGAGGAAAMFAGAFVKKALKSEFGGHWENGKGKMFNNSADAFLAGVRYNFRHNSWANTFYGSYEATLVGYTALKTLGTLLSPESVREAIDAVRNRSRESGPLLASNRVIVDDACPPGVDCGNPIKGNVHKLNDVQYVKSLSGGWVLLSHLDDETKERKVVACLLPMGDASNIPRPPGIGHSIARPVYNFAVNAGMVLTNFMTAGRYGFENFGKDNYSTAVWWFYFSDVYFPYTPPDDIDLKK